MVVWSLFDGSGIMGLPWAQAGHDVFCFNFDGGNHGEYEVKMHHEKIHYVNVWIDNNFNLFCIKHGIPSPNIIFAFPDCTMFAHSGAQHKRIYGEVNQALAMAKLTESLGRQYCVPWMVENPVGKLSTLWRKPDYYFNPFEYGGYMSGFEPEIHPKMPVRDGYTKKTCLWTGGGFVMPEKKPVEHIGKFWGWAFLGGKSSKTKQLRSLTPRGFARAVYEANK